MNYRDDCIVVFGIYYYSPFNDRQEIIFVRMQRILLVFNRNDIVSMDNAPLTGLSESPS